MFRNAHELVLEAKKSVQEIEPSQVHAWLQTEAALLIDVREPEEFAQGHLQHALNIPRGLLEFKVSGEPGLQQVERPLLVYCKTSGRAALSVVTLQSMGFTNVASIAGGFDGWLAAGLPVHQPKPISFE